MKTIVAIAAVLFIGGCTLENGEAPALIGPSEFALSVALSATPDRLPRDGSSQSVITATVRDESSRPVAGQRLTVSTTVGTVSETDIVTNGTGQASVTFTAPEIGTARNEAQISFILVGTNAGNATARTLTIAFTGPSNTSAPQFAPTPFTVTPDKPEVNSATRFDATGTVDASGKHVTGVFDEDKPCLNLCTYIWDFGDGSTDAGRIVNHTFTKARTYTVTLTVIDDAGTTASIGKSVIVNSVPAPSVTALTVSPTSPIAGQLTTFTAKADPATGHSIQTFAWNFGDGSTQTTAGPTVVKTYSAAGTYVVTVTATDDLGQQGSISISITVSSGISFPQPPFTVSPASPTTAQEVSFNASGVTTLGGATLTQYEWDFGDGKTGTGITPKHSYKDAGAGTYVVRLTVTDSAGRTGTTTAQVSVTAAP